MTDNTSVPMPSHNDWDEPCQHESAWNAVTTHTRTVNGIGPDHCQECSEAVEEWVVYPCTRSLR